MLYLYDEAIIADMREMLNVDENGNNLPVFMIGDDKDSVSTVAAMLQEDKISFPIICFTRGDYGKDSSRSNFTWTHLGVSTVMDPETNLLYYEKRIPIKFDYTVSVYGVNQVQVDELVRELMFHYSDMFFLSILLPYESSAPIRFGVEMMPDSEVKTGSGVSEYYSSGALYESDFNITVLGAFLVNYTPVHLNRIEVHTDAK